MDRQPAAQTLAKTWLTRADVARLLQVSPNTVTRWAHEGRLACQLTLGGHHRFDRDVVEELRRSLRSNGDAEPEPAVAAPARKKGR